MLTLLLTGIVALAFRIQPVKAEGPVLAAPNIVDSTLVPGGDAFGISINVSNVERLFGYQFVLSYDTSVLTAVSFGPFPPFTVQWPGEINDTAGYVAMSFSFPLGEETGFATVDPAPIAWISFVVDDFGTSVLELSDTGFIHVDGGPIPHDTVDGFFTNVVLPAHDIAVTHVTAYPTYLIAGHTVTIYVKVVNEGTETETFDVTVKYNETEIETKTVTDLASGSSETLTFSWDTTGMSTGEYVIKAEATVVEGEVDTADNIYIDGTVSIFSPPVASFTWGPETPYVRENVTFDASASYDTDGTIVKYKWYFGDDTPLVEETDPITTHVYTAAGAYRVSLWVIDDDGLQDSTEAYVTVLPVKMLRIKLSGELDYFWKERVKIRLSALVRDAETMEPVSDANVTIHIYDQDGNLWVSDVMVEKLTGTGIYEWESSDTIMELQLEKGVYLVHAQASYQKSPIVSDILEFHVDPPAEGSSGASIYYVIVPIIVCAAGAVTIFLKRSPRKVMSKQSV